MQFLIHIVMLKEIAFIFAELEEIYQKKGWIWQSQKRNQSSRRVQSYSRSARGPQWRSLPSVRFSQIIDPPADHWTRRR